MSSSPMKVTPNKAGSRLDLFLKEQLPDCSRKAAKRLLDAGRVRVNGRKAVIASWELQRGDEVLIADAADLDIDVSKYFLKVVYEDEALLVIEKDAGMACESSPLELKPSLIQLLNAYLRKQVRGETVPYIGLIHRLDTETSGLMVYTKKKAANKISEQFKRHQIERRYQAVVVGRVVQENGIVKKAIEKLDQPGALKVRVSSGRSGQRAETLYRLLERYGDASWLEIMPRTGRTHQIRVHMASIGHPIWADKIYGSQDPQHAGYIKRQALHASVLGFQHPISGKKLKFTSDLPRDMRRLIDRLRVKG